VNDIFVQPGHATPLTPEEQEGLKQTWITTRADLNEAEQINIDEAIAWTGKLGDRELLTVEFVFDLHKRMFGDVWGWAGTRRNTGKNIGVDPPHIYLRLGGLLDDARFWIQDAVYPPDEIATRLHHGLVLIHPFANGNGRHARLMADALIVQLGGEVFTWGGGGTLQDMGQLRNHYIHALRQADDHDFGELIAFVRS
jgi:Fic-DOC domain mobile mystery protein B